VRLLVLFPRFLRRFADNYQDKPSILNLQGAGFLIYKKV
jgi:hypothetical protein